MRIAKVILPWVYTWSIVMMSDNTLHCMDIADKRGFKENVVPYVLGYFLLNGRNTVLLAACCSKKVPYV